MCLKVFKQHFNVKDRQEKKIQTIQKWQGWSRGWVRWEKARQMSRDVVVESNSNMLAFAVVSLNDRYHAYQKGKITG